MGDAKFTGLIVLRLDHAEFFFAMLPRRSLVAAHFLSRRLLCTASNQRLVRVARDDADATVTIVTLNQPDNLNAMTATMGDEIEAVVADLRSRPPSELRAVVLTGAGRAFSAGGDLAFLDARRDDSPTSNAEIMRRFYARFLSIRKLPVPVVACINGPAIGAGLCFAMAADVRVTHDKAKLGFTFVGLGLHPGMGATHTIALAAGAQTASRMLLTGDIVGGQEALALGLVTASCADAPAALAETLGIARRIAAQSPLAVRATLQTLRQTADFGLDAALQREADAQAQSYASADYAEGLAAIKAKVTPSFPGR
jgi:enoyl-CoA hydratase/carnithine racemase